MASHGFFWQLMKKSRMVMKFDLYDTLMICNGILIVFHSYCCSKITFILSTILIAIKLPPQKIIYIIYAFNACYRLYYK